MQCSDNDLRKQYFIRVGGEEGLQLLDLESGGHIYELCVCVCVCVYRGGWGGRMFVLMENNYIFIN